MACSSGVAALEENSDPDYQQLTTLAPPLSESPTVDEMDLEQDRLLKQIQHEMARNDSFGTMLRYDFRRHGLRMEKARLVAELVPRRADLLSKRQKLAQARAKLEHIWLLLERCPNYETLDDYVRRQATELADKRAAAELEPKARKRYLSRYLRLLKSLARRAARANFPTTSYSEPVPKGE